MLLIDYLVKLVMQYWEKYFVSLSIVEVRSLRNTIVCHSQLKLSMDETGNRFHLFYSQHGINRYVCLFHYTGGVFFSYSTMIDT